MLDKPMVQGRVCNEYIKQAAVTVAVINIIYRAFNIRNNVH